MLDLIIKAIIESGRESRRAEEARRAWEQQRAWEEQQRLWQAQQQQWAGNLQPPDPAARAHVPPPAAPRTAPLAAKEPPQVVAGGLSRGVAAAPPAKPRSGPPAATAPAIAQWMRPETLRSQFILTEILKPPLALRPPRV